MEKDSLLRNIAETAYNIGFGAKKHFASFDIIEKGPNWIGFTALSVGIFGLIWEPLSTKVVSAALTVMGIAALYISLYSDKSNEYSENGKKLLALYDELKILYFTVKSNNTTDLSSYITELQEIQRKSHGVSISKQIFPSDWYAHYKFFWQHQIGWIDEQKNFKFFRDKIPLSFLLVAIIGISAGLLSLAKVLDLFPITIC